MEYDKRVHVDKSRMNKVRQKLTRVLTISDKHITTVTRPTPRRMRMFTTTTTIKFSEDKTNQRTIMELITGDRRGLLSDITHVFVVMDINIDNAKILTIGERAKNVFYISNAFGKTLSDESCSELRQQLLE
jgi:[protein-PII] uridylyltransferase